MFTLKLEKATKVFDQTFKSLSIPQIISADKKSLLISLAVLLPIIGMYQKIALYAAAIFYAYLLIRFVFNLFSDVGRVFLINNEGLSMKDIIGDLEAKK